MPSPGSGVEALLGSVPGGLFRQAPLPVLVVDARTRLVHDANRAMAALLERLPEELRGSPFDDLTSDPPEQVAEHLLLVLAARDERPHRRTLLRWNGASIPVEVSGAPLDPGRSPLVVLFARDVHEDREVERERGRLQSQLWMAQKHEAVGRLAAGIAHDFSNLLSVVMLTAEGLRDRLAADDEARGDLDLVTDACFRARELTVELLAFSGRQMREPVPVSLNEVVLGMEGLLRRAVPENVDLVVRPCGGQAAVNADPAQLEQVLLNLVTNARDAMPDGGYVMISTQEVELDEDFARDYATIRPGPHVLLSVSDSGLGMDEETSARIFEPFFSTRGRGRGAGLGLSTVYGIVKQSRGSIWVDSAPGAGSTFRIYLPRLPSAPPRRRADSRGIRVGGVPGGTEGILLVEDDADVRARVAEILEELGYTVTRAASPDQAIEIHDDLWPEKGPHPVDLLLTDVIMPGISGVELARRIRTKREDLRVMYVSGYLDPLSGGNAPDHDASRRGARPGGGPYLAKPFTREELARGVRAALEGGA